MGFIYKSSELLAKNKMDKAARVPCACCGDQIIYPPDKKRTDFLFCSCPSHPLICGFCRNRKECCICLWCRQSGPGWSIRSPRQALKINLLAKRWESFRTDHPDHPFFFLLTDNWCNFVRYDQLKQTIETFTKKVGLTD